MYNHILHATDLNETHFSICEKAVHIAGLLHAKLYLLHVIDLPVGVQLSQGLGFTQLAAPSTQDAWTVMNILGDAVGIPVDQQRVAVGSAGEIIAKTSKELGCDLILIGNHLTEGLPGMLGSTTGNLVLHTSCDVMILTNSGLEKSV